MKRVRELIRKIILAVEDAPHGSAPFPLAIEGYTDEQVGYHAHLLIQAECATGHDISAQGDPSPGAMLESLTWAGHEFAAVARDESRWKEAMGVVREKGGSVTLGVLTQLLAALMKRALGLP